MSAFCIHDRDPESCSECEADLDDHRERQQTRVVSWAEFEADPAAVMRPGDPVSVIRDGKLVVSICGRLSEEEAGRCGCDEAAEERAAILAWLKTFYDSALVDEIYFGIERGEHLTPKEQR